MTDSPSLRHFPDHDPPPGKDKERSKLEQDIEAYLNNGGEISQHDMTESGQAYPVRRSRKAQINFLRKRDYRRSKAK